MAEKPPTSFRLSPECRQLIRSMADRLGIKDAAVLEIAVRRMAAQELGEAATGWEEKPKAKRPRKKK